MKRNGRKREAREDTISEVGRQTTVPDHSPAGKSEIATRDEGWLRDGGGRGMVKRIDARP